MNNQKPSMDCLLDLQSIPDSDDLSTDFGASFRSIRTTGSSMPDDLGFTNTTTMMMMTTTTTMMPSNVIDEFQQEQSSDNSTTTSSTNSSSIALMMEQQEESSSIENEQEVEHETVNDFSNTNQRIMEQPSIEALVTTDPTTTTIVSNSPQRTRMKSETNTQEKSQHTICQLTEPSATKTTTTTTTTTTPTMTTMASRRRYKSPRRNIQRPMTVTTTATSTTTTMQSRSLQDILHQCASLTLPLQDITKYWQQSEAALVTALVRTRNGQDMEPTSFSYSRIRRSSEMPDPDCLLLHSLFATLASPSPTLASIHNILSYEREFGTMGWKQKSRLKAQNKAVNQSPQQVDLPLDTSVSAATAHKKSVVSLLRSKDQMLELPIHFQLAFFRILIRLLTNETDEEYNEACLFTCEWWEQEEAESSDMTHPSNPTESPLQSENLGVPIENGTSMTSSFQARTHERIQKIRKTRQTLDQQRKRHSGLLDAVQKQSRQNLSIKRPNQLYTIVRFRSGGVWNTRKGENEANQAVTCILDLFQSILDDEKSHHLLAPVSRLLGLLCTAGISVKELRRILALAGDSIPSEGSSLRRAAFDRLLLIRALATAAEGASPSSQLVGKASPRYFFSFRKSAGLTRTMKSLPAWPFRNDFGVAFWFRAENFDGAECPKLLNCRTPDGGGIEVALVPLDQDSKVTVITVTTFDSNSHHDTGVQHVILKGCLILPRVWYHLAIRHTQSRLKGVFSLGARQCLSIILDGKVLLTEPLKFPNITYSEVETTTPSSLLGLRRTANTTTLTVQFGADFEGQTGALYLFNDNISDATLRALYEVTAGTKGLEKQDFLKDNTWDSIRGDFTQTHASVVEIATVDAAEIAMTSSNRDKQHQILDPMNASIVDLGEEEGSSDFSVELTRVALGSKIFLVWDPKRTEGMVTLDLHSGAHVTMDTDKVQPWYVDGAKNVIGSIGGVQALLPVFQNLLSGAVEREWQSLRRSLASNEFDHQVAYSLIPNLIILVSSFLRDHDENAREILRCGGIDIIENFLLANKSRQGSNSTSNCETMLGVLALHPGLSTMLLDALVDLRSSCSQYEALESTVFTRLFFNMPLWFEDSPGVGFHVTLLPLLSSLASTSPKKVRDCVGTKTLIEALKQNVHIENEDFKNISQEAGTQLFDRSSMSGLDREASLTIKERRHAFDIILGIIASVLVTGANPTLLGPLINYISSNLDYEWELATQDTINGRTSVKIGVRQERHLSAVKATSVLLFLLKGRPLAPGICMSLTKICGGPYTASSWILCALVNSYDDEVRSLGIRCFAEYMDVIPFKKRGSDTKSQEYVVPQDFKAIEANAIHVSKRLSASITNMGKGLAAIGSTPLLSSIIQPSNEGNTASYKLLWHLLKSHRTRIGPKTHSALVNLLLYDRGVVYEPIFLIQQFVVSDDVFCTGYAFNMNAVETLLLECESVSGKKLRQGPALNTMLRLIRYLPEEWKERWLLDLVDLISTFPTNLALLVECPEWQPSLFHLISEAVEDIVMKYEAKSISAESECKGGNIPSDLESSTHSSPTGERVRVKTRFDLTLKLYTGLLGYCFRQGGEKSLHAIEHTASLQRVCANGHEVLCLIMNHMLANLIDFGTVEAVSATLLPSQERNKLLKGSARIVTNAIIANGSNGVDATSAVRQWQSLRHLAATASAIVTNSGFTLGALFDYSSQSGSAVDIVSKGVYGIRLPDDNVPGMSSADYIDLIQAVPCSADGKERFRRVSLSVTSQTLALLDAFIFPDSLDASLPTSQLHGLALVRSNEARLGKAQGPLIASLMRLSLTLLCRLEPSSVKFLQSCSRLRCLLHWSLELIRESVALAGYSAAFHDLTAPLDRLILATVLQCHRSLAKCATLLMEIESSPNGIYFPDEDSRKRNHRRLLRVSFELREILLAAYRGRNEVLRAALSHEGFDALQAGLEQSVSVNGTGYRRNGGLPVSKEAMIRNFLFCSWVKGFHDIEMRDSLALPEQVANGQVYKHKKSSHRGVLAVEEMAFESNGIILDFNRALDTSFEAYCEDQRKWADTGAVRELEFEGDSTAKKLVYKHQLETSETARTIAQRAKNARSLWLATERLTVDLWNCEGSHWQLARHADRLNRRILFTRNRNFDNHQQASYELMLGLERDKAIRLREERLRKDEEKQLSDVLDVVRRNSGAMVPFIGLDDSIVASGEDGEDDENEIEDLSPWHNEAAESDTLVEKEIIPFFKEFESEGIAAPSAESYIGGDADIVMVEGEDAEIIDPDAWAKFFIWSDTESIVARFENVMIVTLRTITEGMLLLTTHGLYFKQSGDITNVMTKENAPQSGEDSVVEQKDLRWRFSRLTEVHGRRFMLRVQAIELFFSDSHELFLNFASGVKERDRFYSKLRNSCKVPMLWSPKSLNPRVVFKKSKLTQLWRRGMISNFHYLMHVNKMAGRTFNDITQYPVFPWVLSDFTSTTIDLNDTKVYRDLTKPVGALNKNRLTSLIERYNDLESFGFAKNERFLYGSHYSSPGVVLHYLIRQEPFTSMAIELQSGRFDCPDRLFFDIAGCWRSCNTSTSDVKELVPELFTCPEVLLNTNNFPFGRTQDSKNIDNVVLPPWANGSAYEFVRIHRLALESEYVSQNLRHWIDLVFGYKQRGAEAEAAHNLFHYLSYEGAVDLDKITDDIDRAATESHIQNFGQTPAQLLIKEAHPARLSGGDRWKYLIHNESVPKHLRCHTPRKQFGGSKNGQARGAVISIEIMSDTAVVVYSDMSVGTYKWGPSRSSKYPFMIRMDKHRLMARRELSTSRSAITRSSAAPQSMENSSSCHSVGNWSIFLTLGGEARESLRRKNQMQSSRLTSSAKDMLSTAEVNALLVSCGYWDDSVKVHTVDGLKLQCSATGGHRGPIRCLTLGDDGALMVTGGQDSTCRVWVVDHPDMAVSLSDGYVQTSLGKGIDGNQILACCHVLWGHISPVTCLAMCSDLDVVVSGSLEGNICVHSVRLGKFVRSMKAPILEGGDPIAARKLVLDNCGTLVAHMEDGWLYALTINGVHLCSVDAGEMLHEMKLTSNGEILVTGGDLGQIVIRTVRDLKLLSILDISRHGPIRCIALTPEDLNPIPQYLFVGSDDGMITVVDEDTLSNDSEIIAFD